MLSVSGSTSTSTGVRRAAARRGGRDDVHVGDDHVVALADASSGQPRKIAVVPLVVATRAEARHSAAIAGFEGGRDVAVVRYCCASTPPGGGLRRRSSAASHHAIRRIAARYTHSTASRRSHP